MKKDPKQFMKDQLHEIDKHKWIESEKAGRCLGDSVIIEWIKKYAQEFRKQWYRD